MVRRARSAAADPTRFVGRNKKGNLRPADDRYLTDGQLDARDAYLLEITGPQAQQLVAKREALAVLLEDLDDDLLTGLAGVEVTRASLIESATTMPNAEYRALLEVLASGIDTEDDAS